jgi:hypothetical protein
MRHFLYPLIFILLLLNIFFNITFPIVNHTVERSLPVHKTLYLGRDLSNEEVSYILEASLEWNKATNGQVSFSLQRLPSAIDRRDAVIVLNATPDSPEIILIDQFNKGTTLGSTNERAGLAYILLVPSRIGEKEFAGVVLHELAHALGMKHITGLDGFGSLMFPSVDLGSKHITNQDLFYFCKTYHCDSRQFHIEDPL